MPVREGPFLTDMGAAMGSLGLIAFAAVCWWFIPRCAAAWVLAGATFVWGSLPVAPGLFESGAGEHSEAVYGFS
jgi:hypothetical protein